MANKMLLVNTFYNSDFIILLNNFIFIIVDFISCHFFFLLFFFRRRRRGRFVSCSRSHSCAHHSIVYIFVNSLYAFILYLLIWKNTHIHMHTYREEDTERQTLCLCFTLVKRQSQIQFLLGINIIKIFIIKTIIIVLFWVVKIELTSNNCC